VPTVGRSPQDDRLPRVASSLSLRSLAGIVGGAGLATATTAADRASGWSLPLDAANAAPLAATLVGALLTIAVFTLWMRTVVVGLASGQLSPRVLSGYLDDGFQQSVTGWMVVAVTYTAVVAALLPAEGTGVPAISTVTAFFAVIAAFGTLLLAMRHAVNSLSPPDVIRSLTDRALELLARRPAPDDPAQRPDPTGWRPLRSATLGWVQTIDHEALLAALPPDTTVLLQITVGEFVAVGETIAYLDPGTDPDLEADVLLDAITVARTRDARDDLAFAIQQLVDVAQHAVSRGSLDTSTAHEALVHLRAVFHELLRHGTATGCRLGDDGRQVLSATAWRPADHLIAAFERLRGGAAQDPTTTRHLLRTMDLLRRTADEVGDERAVAVLDEQRDRLVAAADRDEVPLTHR
jgi:uncharacterized membrane protein